MLSGALVKLADMAGKVMSMADEQVRVTAIRAAGAEQKYVLRAAGCKRAWFVRQRGFRKDAFVPYWYTEGQDWHIWNGEKEGGPPLASVDSLRAAKDCVAGLVARGGADG